MIEIVPYRTSWPETFRSLGAAIRDVLGNGALAIHHIGSTSVPFLAAKDIIDIQVTVRDIDPHFSNGLESIGFVLQPLIASDHAPAGLSLAPAQLVKQLYKLDSPKANLHVRGRDRFNQRYPLLFRDYLRAIPLARDAYAEIKLQLARRFGNDADAYYDVKDPVCDALIAGAHVWAEHSGWCEPASDA